MSGDGDDGDKTLPFSCEYAKSGRAACKLCKENIAKDTLRLAVMIQSPHFDGKMPLWYHFDCFWRKAKNVTNEADIRGFDSVRWEDQEKIRKCMKGDTSDLKPRTDTKITDYKIEVASAARAKCQSCAEKIVKNVIRVAIIEGKTVSWYDLPCFAKNVEKLGFHFQPQDIPGFDSLKEENQDTVKNIVKPQLKRKSDSNESGPIDKKPKVEDVEKEKEKLKVQSEKLWQIIDQLTQYVNKKEAPALLTHNNQLIPVGEIRTRERLSDCMLFGALEKCPECGGGTSLNTYKCTYASEWSSCEYSTQTPKRVDFVIPKSLIHNEYLAKFKFQPGLSRVFPSNRPDRAATSNSLDGPTATKSPKKEKVASRRYLSSGPKSQKVTLKGGAAVEPQCEIADKCHVYKSNKGTLYTTSMSNTDLQSGTNSFYKLQLLELDQKKKYYVFRAWGRLGTTIGGTKLESFNSDLEAAKDSFKLLFSEKSGNEWKNRDPANFVKYPRKMNINDIDYGQNEPESDLKISSQSKLPEAVQSIVQLIFDVKQMNETLKEFEIDTQKMPLGKLSKAQLQKAYTVLSELQQIMVDPTAAGFKMKVIEASNRFYTLIPQDFGMQQPTPLDNPQIIREKAEMVDNLLEIELAYNILKNEKSDGEVDPIDSHYHKLNTDMKVVDKDTQEFKLVQKYIANTHAKTHSNFKLQLEELICVDRKGEKARYKQFSELHNRQLLWHGSRVSNYAGILSQGLRIAPPEAPVTGYMFGKGVYFADMVSKSANYCHPSASNNTGILLLCEVALGDMYERFGADPIKKLPKQKHSTKGVGRTAPDPCQVHVTEDGVTIPFGKGKDTGVKKSSLLYNEFIVYDTAQINMKYLLKTKFVYN